MKKCFITSELGLLFSAILKVSRVCKYLCTSHSPANSGGGGGGY